MAKGLIAKGLEGEKKKKTYRSYGACADYGQVPLVLETAIGARLAVPDSPRELNQRHLNRGWNVVVLPHLRTAQRKNLELSC